MENTKKQSFVTGALILSLGTGLVKVISALFKVPLTNLIGLDGFANFSTAYQVYATLFVIATAGLPVAISKLVAEARAKRQESEISRIFSLAMFIFVVFGIVGSCFLFFGARMVAGWMGNPAAAPAMMAISPSVLFVCVTAAFRGYYQGHGNMIPTTLSQIIEAICKLIFGYSLAYWIFSSDKGVELAAAGAIGGITIGTILGAVYMMVIYRKGYKTLERRQQRALSSRRDLMRRIVGIAIPVTLSSSVQTFTNMLDSALVMRRLPNALGWSDSFGYIHYIGRLESLWKEQAKTLYGALATAQNLFNLPPAFILTLAISVLPFISAAMARQDMPTVKKSINSSLKLTALLALPAAVGLSVLSEPILRLLYQPETAALAAPLLYSLGFAVFFVCLVTVTNSILQSMGLVRLPIITMTLGCIVKIATNLTLVDNPNWGIRGAPVGTLLCFLTMSALNLLIIGRAIGSYRFLRVFVKPLLAAVLMGIIAHGANLFITGTLGIASRLAVIPVIAVAGAFYLLLVFILRILSRDDMLLLPKGEKLARKLYGK